MKGFPKMFCEESITSHGKSSGAEKHCTSGYRLFKADKVSNILLHHDKTATFIKAKVEASFSVGKLYDVVCVVCMDDGSVKHGHCLCPAGAGGVCKHVSALLWHMLDIQRMGHLFIPDTMSCTSKPRTWGPVNFGKRKLQLTNFSKLEFAKHIPGKVPKRQAEPFDGAKVVVAPSALKTLCAGFKESGFCTMLADHIAERNYRPDEICHISVVHNEDEAPINLPLYALGGEVREGMACSLSLEEAHELEKMTRGQDTPLWHEERKKRLTASRFGEIVLRKSAVNEKFIASFLTKASNRTTRYMRSGQENEANGIAKYKEHHGVEVYKVGLCVNPGAPFLGASPDGLVWDKRNDDYGLVEVKTLAKAMEEGLTVKEATQGAFLEGRKAELQAQVLLPNTRTTWHYRFNVVRLGC